MTSRDYNIAVLMPTHRRTDALRRSLFSLIDLAHDLESVQFRLGIDNNDEIGLNYFIDNIQPELDARNINYEALEFEPLGYAGLNQYFNTLAQDASADWLFVWCDDAIMQTQDWDQRIRECTGEFKLLKVHTHNEHPYSIFPIYPAQWIETLGYVSRHQMGDAESSQIAYLLDLMKIIEVDVTHDRADLTGNNKDEAYKKRELLEGNPNNPRDLHNEFFNLKGQPVRLSKGFSTAVGKGLHSRLFVSIDDFVPCYPRNTKLSAQSRNRLPIQKSRHKS